MPKARRREQLATKRPAKVRRRLLVFGVGLVVIVAAAFVLSRAWPRTPRPASPGAQAAGSGAAAAGYNLLLVTLDTTRADHLGIYGHARARTPTLDQLAREGARFDRAFSPAPLTLPAHASILTGLYPFAHGVRNNGNFYMADRFDTLATILKERGYRTAAFVSAFILDRRYGLARGFDTYDDRMEGQSAQILALEAERRGDRTVLALSAWLGQHAAAGASSPFFAWLHLYDPHEPYHAPAPFGPAFADSPYDGEIAFDDAAVAAVMDRLAQLGLKDRTLVAVVGDHGESLGEHGEETHSMFVYDAALRVPLIVWAPGVVPGRVIETPVRITDLAPTVLDLLGAPPLKTSDGRSLVAEMRGQATSPPPEIYAETLFPQLYMNWAPLRALRDERWQFIEAPHPELYDTIADPGEMRNLVSERAQTARGLQQRLDRMTGGATGEMSVGRMDRETLEKLASLGYVGAGAEPAAAVSGTAVRTDPKEMIGVFNRLRAANSAVRDRRFADALPILREVLAADPRNAFAQLVLGSAHMGMGDYRAAIGQYRKYLELVPTSSYAHQWMAICYLRLQDRDAALREAEAALAIDPHFSDARVLKGGVLAARGEYPGAIAELRAAVDADPAKVALRLDLANVLAEAGRDVDARTEYEAALKLQADYAPALIGFGAFLAKQSKLDEAAALLQRALEIQPAADDARFNLAKVLARQGRVADARAEYQRLAGTSTTPPAIRAAARRELASLRAR